MKQILLLLLVCVGSTIAQTPPTSVLENNTFVPPREILVESWKKGTATVSNQTLKIALSSKNRKYSKVIIADTGKKFLLRIKHNPYSLDALEHWEVYLFEHPSRKEFPPTLLAIDRYQEGGEYLGVLYPRIKPIVVSENDKPLYGDGYDFYHIATVRKIHIENFVMTIRVERLEMNKKNSDLVDLMEVFIEFGPK